MSDREQAAARTVERLPTVEVYALTASAPVRLATGVGGHMPCLDGVRGIAILLVMAYHFIPDTHHHPIARFMLETAHAGWLGVDLFFVLSGFLITGILLRARGRPRYFRTFYIRRTLRIFPLYYAVLAAVFIAGAVVPSLSTDSYREMSSRQAWLWLYAANWAQYLSGGLPFVCEWAEANHFWSLAVEEQFYLAWPAVVLALSRGRLIWVCTGLVVGAAVIRAVAACAGFEPPLNRADGLVLGALIAVAARSPGGPELLVRWSRPAMAMSSAALLSLGLWRGGLHSADPVIAGAGITLAMVFFGAVVVQAVAARPGGAAHRALGRGPLVVFGRYSYGLYVFHWLLNPLITTTVIPVFPTATPTNVAIVNAFILFAFKTAVSLGVAWLSFHIFESWFLRMRTRLGA